MSRSQSSLAKCGRGASSISRRASRLDVTARTQLGPYWLWWRADRDDWCICWYDDGTGTGSPVSRRTRRLGTGIGGGGPDRPPAAAQDALAAHYLAHEQPKTKPVSEVLVETLFADWIETRLIAPASAPKGERKLSDPGRYATSIKHWIAFFASDRRAGNVMGAHTVADVGVPALVERFIAWRAAAGVGQHTISRDLAALRATLNWAWRRQRITSAPFIADVGAKPPPRELVYSAEQVARLLDVTRRRPERAHVHLYIMIVLSTVLRGEAVLELDASQVRDGLIDSNAPSRAQTSKRRARVPICATLAPWLDRRSGKVIQYAAPRSTRAAKRSIAGDDPFVRPTLSIKTAFRKCLVEAGMVDIQGRPLGSPNTLRHTIITELHRRGVPEAQIDMAAGHVGEGTGKRNYRHLRPEHMAEFLAGVEDYWREIGQWTNSHLRYQRDTHTIPRGRAPVQRGRRTTGKVMVEPRDV